LRLNGSGARGETAGGLDGTVDEGAAFDI